MISTCTGMNSIKLLFKKIMQKVQRKRQSFPRLSFPPSTKRKAVDRHDYQHGCFDVLQTIFFSNPPLHPPPPPPLTSPTTLQQARTISYTSINYNYISSFTLCPCLCSSETSTSPALSNCSVCRCRQKE